MSAKQRNGTRLFEISLLAEQLHLLQKVFTRLVENEKNIEWWEDHTLPPIDDLKHIMTKFNNVKVGINGEASLCVNFIEWVAFSAYVEYSSRHYPDREVRFLLEDMAEFLTNLSDSSLIPF